MKGSPASAHPAEDPPEVFCEATLARGFQNEWGTGLKARRSDRPAQEEQGERAVFTETGSSPLSPLLLSLSSKGQREAGGDALPSARL